jgi:hypothetical protein
MSGLPGGKRLLGMIRPPKPIAKMTDDEIAAFAEHLASFTRARLRESELSLDSENPERS